MRAAIIEKPYTLTVRDVPVPSCGEDEILIRIHRASICNQSDWEVYAGTSAILDYIGGYPHILGHEQSGEVVEIGRNVRGFALGDRVTTYWRGTGGFAEYNTLNPSKLAVIKLDDRVSYDEGAVLELAGGAVMRNVYGSTMRPTDMVAVMGAGPAGLCTGMVAKLFGAKAWIAIDLVPFRLQKALALGAAAAYNLGEMSREQVTRAIQERFGEVDVVFETMGEDHSSDESGLELAIAIVKPGGDVRLFSFAATKHRLPIGNALLKGVNFIGRKVTIEKTRDLLAMAHGWVVEGRYPIKEIITHHVTLEDAEKGMKLLHEHPEQAIKVVVDIT